MNLKTLVDSILELTQEGEIDDPVFQDALNSLRAHVRTYDSKQLMDQAFLDSTEIPEAVEKNFERFNHAYHEATGVPDYMKYKWLD